MGLFYMFKRIIGLFLCLVIVMIATTVCISESADVGEIIEEYTAETFLLNSYKGVQRKTNIY